MSIDRETVRRIAELARLDVEVDEVDRYAEELASIVDHFEELAELDLEGEGGPEDRGLPTRLRPDAPGSDTLAREPREMAPAWRGGFFEVPRLDAMREEGESP